MTQAEGNLQTVSRKAAKSIIALGLRQVLVQGVNVIGGIFLARLLTPAEFGLFAIVTFLQTFLLTFGSTGLAVNLIRQTEEPTPQDYRAVFSFQQLVVLGISSAIWLSAPLIAHIYDLSAETAWIFRLLALSLVITSFMVIPQVRLERHLLFHKLALVEVIQAVGYNFVAVGLAWWGFGAMSFVVALLVRSIAGAGIANWIEPSPLTWYWNWSLVKKHLQFSLFYQGAQLISVVKDSITPIFIGLMLDTSAVGYVNWAGMVAAYPVLALMVLRRVYMPLFAKLQPYPEMLSRLVEKIVWLTNSLVAPLAVLTLVLIEPLTQSVFGEKWLVALPLFYFLWAANLFVPTVSPLLGLFDALGHSRIVMMFSVIWMLGTWLLGIPLILYFGVIGFAIANLGVQFSNFWVYRTAQQTVRFRLLPYILPVWILAFTVGAVIFLLQLWLNIHSLILLILLFGGGIGLYVLVFVVLYPRAIREGVALLRGDT